MKKSLLFLIIICNLLIIGLASASYGCSNGTLEEDTNDIDIGEAEKTNGIGIGVIKGEGAGLSADILIDSKSILLTNNTLSIRAELVSGNYDVKLINLTEGIASIKIGGETGGIEKGETKKIDDLQVHLTEVNGTYPGEGANVRLLVGLDSIFFYYNYLIEIKNIGGTDYLFEFFSSSSTSAAITVKKCESGDLIEIKEGEINETSTNETSTNETSTNETSTNETSTNETDTNINGALNDTEDINTNKTQNLGQGSASTISESILKIINPYGILFFIGVLIIILVIRLKNKIKEMRVVEEKTI